PEPLPEVPQLPLEPVGRPRAHLVFPPIQGVAELVQVRADTAQCVLEVYRDPDRQLVGTGVELHLLDLHRPGVAVDRVEYMAQVPLQPLVEIGPSLQVDHGTPG